MKNVLGLFIMITLSLFSQAETKNIPENSLFHLQTKWTDQDGKLSSLKELKGPVIILSMVYLSCHYLCPTIISEIQKLEAKLSPSVKEKVQIVLVTFDPDVDTPTAMKAYAKKRKLDEQRWTLFNGKTDLKTRELAAALNFKYEKIEGGDFTHSFLIAVLNTDGELVARIDGANQDLQPLVDSINRLLLVKK